MAASGTIPQKIDRAAAGEPSSAASVGEGIPAAIAATGVAAGGELDPADPAARVRRAAPWTKIAVPAPPAGRAPSGARSQTASPSASARGSPQALVDIVRRLSG